MLKMELVDSARWDSTNAFCVAVLGDTPEESPFNVGTYTHLSGFKD